MGMGRTHLYAAEAGVSACERFGFTRGAIAFPEMCLCGREFQELDP